MSKLTEFLNLEAGNLINDISLSCSANSSEFLASASVIKLEPAKD